MAEKLRIRDATLDDVGAIAFVHLASWRETYAELLPAKFIEGNTLERRHAVWHGVLERRERIVLVACDDHDTPFGFICGGGMPAAIHGRTPIPSHDAYVDALYVLAAKHRRGIGRTLLTMLANRLHARGFASLALHVLVGNAAAGFYERLGARILSREEPWDDGGFPVIAYGWDDISRIGR